MSLTLHGYWRSSAAYRVRIALNLKKVDYGQENHNLRTDAHRFSAYRLIAPQALVPSIETDNLILTQSPAILEWIEECWATPPLLPESANDRAIVRSMCAIIACDIHPLNNLRVLKEVRELDAGGEAEKHWVYNWIQSGFEALEIFIARHGNGFAFGDRPTLADCFLIPQVYSARRLGFDLTPYPKIVAVDERASTLIEFAAAHPNRQPDADCLQTA